MVQGGCEIYRWFVYITTTLLREASWFNNRLYCGIPELRLSAKYIVSSVGTSFEMRPATMLNLIKQYQ